MSFRKLARAALGVALLVPFATCADLTGPSGGRGVRVPVIPTFSPAASFAKAVYAAAGIEFDRVRVVIVRGQAEVLKDTTVAFSPSSAELTLPLLITANPGEIVTATLEYRSADIVLYSGTQSVTTVATGASPTTPPTPLVLVPVGPGASAAAVEISPTSGSFPTSGAVPFAAIAFTPEHSPIANAIFGWTVEDVSVATVNAQGVVQPTSKGGAAKVRATTLNGKFAEATITFITPPASLAIQSGGGQTAQALDALTAPIVVKVLDANAVPVPGATVNFAVATGGGAVTVVNGVSNAAGLVSANWTLGATVGPQSITATASALPNNPITINATATERPAKTIAFGQQPTKTAMQAAITPAVTVKALDDKGNVVVGFTGPITIGFDANPTSASLGGTLTVNAIAGVATFADLSVSKPGENYTLKASTSGALAAVLSSAFNVDQVPAGLSLNSGGSQSKTINSALDPIVVKIADASGNGVVGVTVTFAVVTGGGTLSATTATTNASGLASVIWTLGSTVGAQSITATSGTLTGSPLTITATATAPAAVGLAFVEQPSNAAANAAISPAVTVRAVDADGKTVTGFAGAITVALDNPNGAALAGTTSATAINGVATFSNLSVNLVGAGYQLKASSGSLTNALSAAFSITSGAPVALKFLVQPTDVVMSVAISPPVQVRVVDASNNTVDVSIPVTISFTLPIDVGLSGNTATTVHGVAAFPALTPSTVMTNQTLTARATGLTDAVSAAFTSSALPAVARTWTGAVSGLWRDAGNWSPVGVPTSADSAIIAPAGNTPVIDTTIKVRSILVQAGASMRINTIDDYVDVNKIYNYGTLILTSGTLYALDQVTFTPIENHAVVNADGSIFTGEFKNVGATSMLRIKGSNSSYGELVSLGTITNDGTIEMDDPTGEDAYLQSSDSIVNRPGATINVKAGGGNGDRDIFGVLRNYGAFNVSTPNGVTIGFNLNLPSVNYPTGTMTFSAGGYFYIYSADSTTLFDNQGLISLGTAEWDFEFGRLKARAGNITGTGLFMPYISQLDIDFTKFNLPMHVDDHSMFVGGSLNVPASQTVRLDGSTITQPTTVAGTLQLLSGTYGYTFLNGGATINNGGLIDARATAQIGANFNANSTLTVLSGGKLTITAASANVEVDIPYPMTNSGTIELTSSGGSYYSGLYISGTLTNAVGGTVNVLGGTGGDRYLQGFLDNKGTISVAGDTYLRLRQDAGTHLNSGTIDLAAGPAGTSANNVSSLILDPYGAAATFTNTGTINIGLNRTLKIGNFNSVTNASSGVIAGKGTIDQTDLGTSFTNAGTIKPGGDGVVGQMTYKGNFSIGTGKVEVDVASITSGDLLLVTGTASVSGLFNIVGSAGCCGTLNILSASSVSGTPTVTPVGFPGGWYIQVSGNTVGVYPNLGSPFPSPTDASTKFFR